MGSCWTICAEEVVCTAFLLFSLEIALARGRWIYLPFAVALFGLLTVFYLYFCALLIAVYLAARIFLVQGGRMFSQWRTVCRLAFAALLGLGLTSPVWLDNLTEILDSPRASGPTSYAQQLAHSGLFTVASAPSIVTALLRPFGNDLLGLGNDYRGAQNYFEAPISYCGLLTLILLPQAFALAGKRRRIIGCCLIGAIALTTIFHWFRYLFWLFQGDYHRTLTFFFAIGAVALSVSAFSHYLRRRALNLPLLAATLAALLLLLYFPALGFQKLIDPVLRNRAAVTLLAYAGLLAAGYFFKRESLAGALIIALCVGELSYFDHLTVSRPTVTRKALEERQGYNDKTVEALREINASETGFFRISKYYPSSTAQHISLNDALAFGFDGTSSYSSFNSIHYINFLKAVGALPENASENETRWSFGLLGRGLFAAFACEKYVLTKEPTPFQSAVGFDNVERYDDIFLFRNRSFLSLGLFYENVVPEETYRALTVPERLVALLTAATVPAEIFDRIEARELRTRDDLNKEISNSSLGDLLEHRRARALKISRFSQSRITGQILCDGNGVLVFQTPFDPGWHATADGARITPIKADFGLLGLPLHRGDHTIEIHYFPPLAGFGAIIAALSALLLALAQWRWTRMR